jgi:hypothetical protein
MFLDAVPDIGRPKHMGRIGVKTAESVADHRWGYNY